MKKIFAILALAIFCLTFVVGCTTSTATDDTTVLSQNSVSQVIEQSDPYIVPSHLEYIGEDAAKTTSLEHAGMTEAEVTFIKIKLEYDDGRTVYDIEFYHDNTEYDYEIDAYTGEIVSHDSDIEEHDIPASTDFQKSGEYISKDEAKAIALGKVNFKEEEVTYRETYFELDDGKAVYKIEFVSGEREYEFEIDAVTGVIIEYDEEPMHD